MSFIKAIKMLKEDEGYRQHPYKCTAGRTTIGYGRNLDDKGISLTEAENLLKEDLSECVADLYVSMRRYTDFPENIQAVLINMRFQLGYSGFRSFTKMIKAFNNRDYVQAIKEMIDSKWYHQTWNRAERLINIVAKYK